MDGWIKLYRSVLEHRHYRKNRVFSEYEAWIDMLLLANYADKVVEMEGHPIDVKRGSFITSQKKLAERWDWDKRRVVSFLKECQEHGEVSVLTEKRWTVVTVLNYENYQGKSVEVTVNHVPTFAPTFAPTLCTDFSPEITEETDISCTDSMHRLSHRSMYTTKEYIKKDKEEIPYVEILNYLNEMAGTRYSHRTVKTKQQIHARFKEGFTFEDFQSVIRCKVAEWKDDARMSAYIRPETLFGTKFESYLNQAHKQKPRKEGGAIPLFVPTKEDDEHYERIRKSQAAKGT